jgi:hypothetical protein
MTIVKLNARKYANSMHGKGIYGKYTKVRLQKGYGIMDVLGKSASKLVLGGIGSSTGKYYGKQLGKLIGEKTGSKLVGEIAKAGLSSLGGVAGTRLGSFAGKKLGDTVFGDEEKKKNIKKGNEKVSLTQLLDQAREKMQIGSGINLQY